MNWDLGSKGRAGFFISDSRDGIIIGPRLPDENLHLTLFSKNNRVDIHMTYTNVQNHFHDQIPITNVPKADYEQSIQATLDSISSSVKTYSPNDYVVVPTERFVEIAKGILAVRTSGKEVNFDFKLGLLETPFPVDEMFEVIPAAQIGQGSPVDFGISEDGALVRKIGSRIYGLGNFGNLANLNLEETPRNFFKQIDSCIGPGFGAMMELLGFPELMEQIQARGLKDKLIRPQP